MVTEGKNLILENIRHTHTCLRSWLCVFPPDFVSLPVPCVFKIGSHPWAHVGLQLNMESRLATNSRQSFCLRVLRLQGWAAHPALSSPVEDFAYWELWMPSRSGGTGTQHFLLVTSKPSFLSSRIWDGCDWGILTEFHPADFVSLVVWLIVYRCKWLTVTHEKVGCLKI